MKTAINYMIAGQPRVNARTYGRDGQRITTTWSTAREKRTTDNLATLEQIPPNLITRSEPAAGHDRAHVVTGSTCHAISVEANQSEVNKWQTNQTLPCDSQLIRRNHVT